MNRVRGLKISCLPPRLSWCMVRGLSSKPVQDCYAILGVTYKADQKQIKENFYKLSKEYHPDLNKDDESALRKFKEIAEAYEILSNPEKRKEFDLKMGYSKSSQNLNYEDESTSTSHQGRRRFRGMKGEFRNGRFVDEEAPPTMRNIEYDLSPERMEKVWKRYKTRWERADELERIKNLEEKKIEFRRRMDLKREKMFQNKMSKEEKAEFMDKIRLHRIDAVEGFDITEHPKKNDTSGDKNDEDPNLDKNRSKNSEDINKSKTKKPDIDDEKEFEKSTRDILKNHFGLSDQELDRLDIGTTRKEQREHGFSQQGLNHNDPIYDGLNSARDATDWRDYVKKTYQKNKETWSKLKHNRVDSSVNSSRYNIGVQKEDNYGVKIVLVILTSAIILGYREFYFESS